MSSWSDKEVGWAGMGRMAAMLVIATFLFGSAGMPACRAAEEPAQHTGKVIWEEDFSDPDLPQWSTGYYSRTGKEGKRTLEMKDGNLFFSSTFPEPPNNRGYASATYLFHDSGRGFLLSDAPILEIRMRLMDEGKGGSHHIILGYQTQGGENASTFDSPGGGRGAGEWFVATYNLYSDPETTGPAGMKYLRNITFYLMSSLPDSTPISLEVDWMRLRQMNESEWGKLAIYLSPLKEFEVQPCPEAENFFGLGFYGLCSPRWGGGSEACADHMARHWVNFILPTGARFGDIMRIRYDPEKSLQENLLVSDLWLKEQRENLDLLKPYGIKYVANMQAFTGGPTGPPVEAMNRAQLQLWAEKVTSALRDEDSILAWYVGDEVRPTFLKKYLVAKELLETRDRSKTAVVLVNGMDSIKTFAPFHQVIVTDKYPVYRPTTDDPWGIAEWMKQIREVSGDAPHWIVLQAHHADGALSGSQTSAIEQRMMSWLALAGGADAVLHFVYAYGPLWNEYFVRESTTSFTAMVDAYGNAMSWFDEYAEFAEKVGPLGALLIKARVQEGSPLRAVSPMLRLDGRQIKGPRERPAVYLGVLQPPGLQAQLLIPVNQDRNGPQPLKITAPQDVLDGKSLYDLVELKEIPRQGEIFDCGTLPPGGGHPYALASPADFVKIKQAIVSARARQALRVAELDLRKAERWLIGTQKDRSALNAAQQLLSKGDYQSALAQAQAVSRSAAERLASDNTYRQASGALGPCQKDLGRMELMLNEMVRLKKKSEELKGVAQKLRADNLVSAAEELQGKVRQLLPEVEAATGLRAGELTIPEKPWQRPELFE